MVIQDKEEMLFQGNLVANAWLKRWETGVSHDLVFKTFQLCTN